jgi:hypothetical protein
MTTSMDEVELASAFTGIAAAAQADVGQAAQLISALALRRALAEAGAACPGEEARLSADLTIALSPDDEAVTIGGMRATGDNASGKLSGVAFGLCPSEHRRVAAVVRRRGGGGMIISGEADRGRRDQPGWAPVIDGAAIKQWTVLATLDEPGITRVYDVVRAAAGAALSGVGTAEVRYVLAVLGEHAADSGPRWAAQAAEHRLVDAAIDADSALLAALESAETRTAADRTRLSAVAALCGLEACQLAGDEAVRVSQLTQSESLTGYARTGEAFASVVSLVVGGSLRLHDLIGDAVLGR